MGSAASVELSSEVTTAVKIAQSSTGSTLSNALEKLWELQKKGEDYKISLFDSSFGIVPLCNSILQNDGNRYDSSNIKFALRIVTSFSTLHQLKLKVAEEPRLNENVMKYSNDSDFITKQNSSTYFRNLCTMEESSIVLQNMRTPFIYAYVPNLSSTDYDFRHATFILCRNICNYLQPHYLEHLIKSQVVAINMKTLKGYGSNPSNWGDERNQIPSVILYFLLNLSFYTEGSDAIKDNGGVDMVSKLIDSNGGESLIAAIIISALIGRDESNKDKASLLQSYPKLTASLMDSYQAALDGGVGSVYEKLNNQWGYNWNFFSLHLIIGAVRNLSLSDSNKVILVATKALLPMLIKTLSKYVNNEPQISKSLESGIDNKIGGGGDDHRSAMIVLESMVSLSYCYEGNSDLVEKYMTKNLGIVSLLEKLLALPVQRNVPDQSRRYASMLMKRLVKPIVVEDVQVNLPVVESTVSYSPGKTVTHIPSAPKKHIMISYAWAANKPFVIKLTEALRNTGYDVWRDEEGSKIVPKLSGDIEANLAAAIDAAHVVIICVSLPYKESINCRSEASYCKLKSKKVLYVMMNENYHTRSSPQSVDGWLAFMLGGDLWYPLWNEKVIPSTLKELVNLIGPEYNVNHTGTIVSNAEAGSSKTTVEVPAVVKPVEISAPAVVLNFDKAWSIISDSMPHIPALEELMRDLGVDSAQYLEGLEQDELTQIASLLPTVKKRLFIKAMCIN